MTQWNETGEFSHSALLLLPYSPPSHYNTDPYLLLATIVQLLELGIIEKD